MLRERHKQRTCEADSIEALPRGGVKQPFFCNFL